MLDPNLSVTGFDGQTVVHTAQVEALLKQVAERGGILTYITQSLSISTFSSGVCSAVVFPDPNSYLP